MDLNSKTQKLKELTDQFNNNIKQYKGSGYDEAKTRVDFIDKFFMLLDWDITNNQGFSENYREVVREDKVQIEGKQKAPDYSFRIGGYRKFFVEAKKPSVFVKEDIVPAFQVRRYGFTAKLALSILTDFEEFAVYDTRIKPDKNDKASVGRIFYCNFEEYEKQFEFIYNTFSKDAILKGSFDKYIDDNKNKKGTSEVDKELLKLVEGWRIELAKNIALRNPDIDIYNLNNAVQKIIDRIIFLRIAEDREIEPYENLLNISKNENIYTDLDKLFINANNKYNAGLFLPEGWLSKLTIDDKILSGIIKELYYPECPYEFSILPIEILGNFYEQFLGKTIKFRNVKDGHTAIIEVKPEVRKAGGVYYTPQYIVNFIVINTVGEKIKGKTPEEITLLRFLDLACGSGSFVVGGYSYLLDYHIEYYTNEKNIKKALKEEKIYQVSEGNYRLTIEEKQKILLNNIYGVDIDPQAVEVTKLSLYLKLLENESVESKDYLFKHSDIKLLPSLDKNIKCGNSLIGNDFYKDKNMSLFGKDEVRNVNAFDWEKEFPEIMKAGGFDVIYGNPPYGYIFDDENIFKYINKKYSTAEYKIDSYTIFLEKAISLLKDNGLLGLIIPYTFISGIYFSKMRKNISNYDLSKLLLLGKKVFNDAEVDTSIIILEKSKKNNSINFCDFREMESKIILNQVKYENIPIDIVYKDINRLFVLGELNIIKIYNKLFSNSIKLDDLLIFYHGIQSRGDKKAIAYEKIINKLDYYKLLKGSDFNRYSINPEEKYFIYEKDNIKSGGDLSFHLSKEKIIIRTTADSIIATIDLEKNVVLNSVNIAIKKNDSINLKYLLSIMNSNLINFWYKITVQEKNKTFAEVKIVYLKEIPIYKIDFSNPSEKQSHDQLVALVDQMLEVQKQFHNAKTENDQKIYKQKIDIIDRQIDELVYKLYGLTEEEIKIVENS